MPVDAVPTNYTFLQEIRARKKKLRCNYQCDKRSKKTSEHTICHCLTEKDQEKACVTIRGVEELGVCDCASLSFSACAILSLWFSLYLA
jgi:hypothetical protein